jgi:hypothetical protein
VSAAAAKMERSMRSTMQDVRGAHLALKQSLTLYFVAGGSCWL